MRRRYRLGPVIAVIAAVVAAVVLVVALTSGSKSDSTSSSSASAGRSDQVIPQLNVGLQYQIPTLDATKAGAYYQTLGLALETLVRVSPQGKLEPWLAEKVDRTNDTTFVYHLRRGVKFSDGNEMTAADVVNSLDYYRAPTSLAAPFFRAIKSVEAKDRYTVVVTLTAPDASWPWQPAAAPGIFEKRFQQAHKATFGKPGTLTIGTGPWKFDSLDPSSGAKLSANPHYWGGAVNVGRIALKFFNDETSEALAFRAGEIDVAFPSDVRAFTSTSAAKVQSRQSLTELALEFDTLAPPWDDIHVRRAVAYAIDRTAILKALGSPAVPSTTLIPAAQLYTLASRGDVDAMLASLPQYPHDLAKARAEMAQSRYAHGATADFNTLAGFGFRDMAQVIKAELAPIGITLNINIVDPNKWAALVGGADRKAIGIQLVFMTANTPDPSELPASNLGSANARAGGFNVSNWAPKDVDALMAQGLTTLAPAKRLAIYGKLLKRVATDVPSVTLGQQPANVALGNGLAWPTFNAMFAATPWALEIRQAK
jgi:peptide/nickel transport system substrate-binding protein